MPACRALVELKAYPSQQPTQTPWESAARKIPPWPVWRYPDTHSSYHLFNPCGLATNRPTAEVFGISYLCPPVTCLGYSNRGAGPGRNFVHYEPGLLAITGDFGSPAGPKRANCANQERVHESGYDGGKFLGRIGSYQRMLVITNARNSHPTKGTRPNAGRMPTRIREITNARRAPLPATRAL